MKTKFVAFGICSVAGLWILWTIGHSKASAEETAPAGISRQSVELTVYKQDFGMVHEQRPSQLNPGQNRLQVMDVSKQLDPQSVLLGWTGGQAEISAHSYDLGDANRDNLLKRYLGKQVEV